MSTLLRVVAADAEGTVDEFKLCRLVLLPRPDPDVVAGLVLEEVAVGVLWVISSRKSRTDCASAAEGGGGLVALLEDVLLLAVVVVVVRVVVEGGPAAVCRRVELDVERGTCEAGVEVAGERVEGV